MKLMQTIHSGDVYVIAEMSANHAGELGNALAIVNAAKSAGADCLKIQTYTADTLTLNCDNEYFRIKGGLWDGYTLYDLYTDAYTPWDWQPAIKAECDRVGIDFLSSPFDNTAVDFLETMDVGAYKIASFELVDIPLIEYAAAKLKPMLISCGMGSIHEIRAAVDACRRMGNDNIILLKCCSEYPANYADMHLANITEMRSHFGVPVGLSDHSMGSIAAVVGASLGACVVEKHFCLSRAIENPDSKFSMEPAEFTKMVTDIKDARKIIGEVSYKMSESEKSSTVFRRSIFSAKDIKAGEEFTTDNLKIVRPSHGLEPKFWNEILGQKAKCDILFGTPLSIDMIEGLQK